MWARAASASTERSAAGCSTTWRWTSRSGSRAGSCAASVALNCDWLPGRRRNSTRWRAICSAGVAVEILLDERQRQVHAGGDAGRGPDRAVAQEDRLGVDVHRRDSRRRARRRRPSAWSRAGRRADRPRRAGRRRCRPRRCAGRSRPSVRSTPAARCRPSPPGAVAARDDQRVDLRAARPRGSRAGSRSTRWRSERPAVGAEQPHLIALVSGPRSRPDCRPELAIHRWAPANTSRGPAKSRLCTPG